MSEEKSRQRVRSPSYPLIGLAKAIEQARLLFEMEHKGVMAPEVIIRHLGHEGMTGTAGRTISALKQYGLLEETEGGLRLAESALDIVLAPSRTAPEVREALRDAALAPKLHRELWEMADGNRLPSNEQMRYYLERRRNFNPRKSQRFISQLRDTIEFAGIGQDEGKSDVRGATSALAPIGGLEVSAASTIPLSPHETVGSGRSEVDPISAIQPPLQIILPLPRRNRLVISLAKPITSEEFDMIKSLLEISKPALVCSEENSPT